MGINGYPLDCFVLRFLFCIYCEEKEKPFCFTKQEPNISIVVCLALALQFIHLNRQTPTSLLTMTVPLRFSGLSQVLFERNRCQQRNGLCCLF